MTTTTVLPRVLVAAPGSGHGKTTVATGLMAALAARGVAVSGHKVGPDYIDPGYHALACGRPARNLDPFLVGEDLVVPLLLHGAAGADVAVVEGVMGLFDGVTGTPGLAGAAHVARLTATPVVLVIDCKGMARSTGAVAHGLATFDPQVRVAGVILNNVASPRHRDEAVAGVRAAGLPVLGALPRGVAVPVPSRHLGLIPAAERAGAAVRSVAELGAAIAEHVDLDALLAVAGTAEPLPGTPWSPAGHLPPAPGRVVALAGGPAFTFSYTETVELLEAAGAQVRVFDPLHDPDLPPGTTAVIIGGGFPQVHAADLSANTSLRQSVSRFAGDGGPVQAECAGLLYLCRELDGAPMCGVVPAAARMTGRLTLGYRRAVDRVTGHRVTGHEFHKTATVYDDPGRPAVWQWTDEHGDEIRDGYRRGPLSAGYLHVHPAGHPWRLRLG